MAHSLTTINWHVFHKKLNSRCLESAQSEAHPGRLLDQDSFFPAKQIIMLKIRSLHTEHITLVVSALLVLAFNQVLWHHLSSVAGDSRSGLLLSGAFGILIFCIFTIVLSLVAFKYVFKPVLITLLIVSAGVVYFMDHYGVLIDIGMLRNLVETNPAEVAGLLSLKLFGYLFMLGALPAWLLYKAPIQYRTWPREVATKSLVCAGSVALIGVVALANYQGLASLLRNRHELRLLVVPSNIIGASFGYVQEQVATVQAPFVKIAEDAKLDNQWATHKHKSLTVLVVGESARAENFGLLGYARDTTPQLQKEPGLVAFTDVHSCGTETAVSVPCMFSNLGRRAYKAAVAKNQEGLLDVLKRAGLNVVWRDNQSGCKGTCDRVTVEDVSATDDPSLCADRECRDEILLKGLGRYIDQLQDNTVLVLHTMGSHGPEYFKRYPPAFEKFTPVCESNALDHCSRESITNAYDNTLLYADHVLASLIDVLREHQGSVDTAMIYLSDHGESLGEYNLFLHGTPYLLAPDQQKHVPLLVWFSDSYKASFGMDTDCLAQTRHEPLSQDNLFHSMLGLLKVDSAAYVPALDLFAGCRNTLDPGALADQVPNIAATPPTR